MRTSPVAGATGQSNSSPDSRMVEMGQAQKTEGAHDVIVYCPDCHRDLARVASSGNAAHHRVPADVPCGSCDDQPPATGLGRHDHSCCPPDDCCGGPCAAHPCWDLTT